MNERFIPAPQEVASTQRSEPQVHLTPQGSAGYAEGRGIFMAEFGGGEGVSFSKGPERVATARAVEAQVGAVLTAYDKNPLTTQSHADAQVNSKNWYRQLTDLPVHSMAADRARWQILYDMKAAHGMEADEFYAQLFGEQKTAEALKKANIARAKSPNDSAHFAKIRALVAADAQQETSSQPFQRPQTGEQQAAQLHQEAAQPRKDIPEQADREVLSRAHATAGMGPIASAIEALWSDVDKKQVGESILVERSAPIRKMLADILRDPPANMSDAQQQEFANTHHLLGNELSKMAKRFKSKELHQLPPEIEQRITRLRDAHSDMDAHLQTPEAQRNQAWELQRDAIYDRIDQVIAEIDFSDGQRAPMHFDAIVRESLANGGQATDEHGNQIALPDRQGKEHYGYAIEYAIERIIGQGDTNPTADYPQFSFYMSNNLDELIQSTRQYSEGVWVYLLNLRGKRQLSHDLFKNLKDRQTLVGIISKALDPGSMRFIEEQIAGTTDVQALFEKEYGRAAAENSAMGKGWLQFDQYRDEIDINVEDMVKNNHVGLRREVRTYAPDQRTKRWNPDPTRTTTRKMRDWELSRAFNMGRAMTGAMLRRQIYSQWGDTPPNVPDLVASLEGGEQIQMILAPLAIVANRYFGTPGAKFYKTQYIERMVEQARHFGAHDESRGSQYSVERMNAVTREMEKFGLFGGSEESTVLLDTGAIDLKSSWWRIAFMLQQKEYGYAHHGGRSIDEFLTDKQEQYRAEVELDGAFVGELDHTKKHERLHRMNDDHEVHDFVANQRLFLGLLATRRDLTFHSKEIIWNNVAQLLPSRIASMLPQYSMDEVAAVYGTDRAGARGHWNAIMKKLFIVEHMRVMDDAQGLRLNPTNGQPMDPNYTPHDLWHYIDQRTDLNFTAQERTAIQRLQSLGAEMAPQLARVIYPRTPFLDDVPNSGFKEWGRNEFERLLINDHGDMEAAYKGIIDIWKNPAKKPDKVTEALHTFVEHVTSAESLEDAQRRVEAHGFTYLSMAKKYTGDVATLDAGKIKHIWKRNHATSDMEKFNMSSGISFDAEAIAGILASWAHHEIISDSLDELDEEGNTQLMRLGNELGANKKRIYFWKAYHFLMVFFPELFMETYGDFLPDEMSGKK